MFNSLNGINELRSTKIIPAKNIKISVSELHLNKFSS